MFDNNQLPWVKTFEISLASDASYTQRRKTVTIKKAVFY